MPISYSLFSTILVVFLTSLLIISFKRGTPLFRLFSKDKVVYIGIISYSLYLWHWGVIVLSRWTIGIHWWSIPFQILLIFFISVGSYEFIEKPFRNFNYVNKFLGSLKILFSSILIGIFSISLGTVFKSKFYLGDNQSDNPPINVLFNNNFFLVGDSHAYDIYNIMLNNKSFKVERLAIHGCHFYELNNKECIKHRIHKRKLINETKKNDVVLLVSDFPLSIFGDSKDVNIKEINKIERYLDEILPILDRKGVFVIIKLPHPKVNPPNVGNPLICKKEFFRPIINPKCYESVGVSKFDFLKKRNFLKEFFLNYTNKYKKVRLWDITQEVCPDKECYPIRKDKVYYRDDNHLFISSSELSDSLIRSLNNLLNDI